MTVPQLNGPALPPAEGDKPEQIVLLLHGVGADGQDLIGLAPFFQQVLPRALFIAPDAPEPFDMAPMGRQWFSIADYIPGSIDIENRLEGVQRAAPSVDAFLDLLTERFGITEENMALIGFSQGTMISLHVGLRREKQLACILAYSGALVGADLLPEEIKSRPPVMLVHGEEDEILPVALMPLAAEGLDAAEVPVEHHRIPGLGHGVDEEAIRLGMRFLARAFGVPVPEGF